MIDKFVSCPRNYKNAIAMLEAKVLRLLKGDSLNENEELCDFTLADQNEACGTMSFFNHLRPKSVY